MLITNAGIYGSPQPASQDLRIADGRIAEIGRLTARPDEAVVDASGGALLPGLHDHHLHLLSYAAALDSVRCGPPAVHDAAELSSVLRAQSGSGWLRGYGYHESVAGDIDRSWLDTRLPDRPARIQHRSGRLWILNSAALTELAARQDADRALLLPGNGRLFDADAALGALLGRTLPPVAEASQRLASFGVTGITDMTPGNDAESLALFASLMESGALRQHPFLAGSTALPYPSSTADVTTAALKIHLHDSALPEFDALCSAIRASHDQGRAIAVHCVTEVELLFALAAIEEAGSRSGDRIEHASVTPPHLLDKLQSLNLTVVTQPNFIAERGDAYLRDLPAEEHAWLYRAGKFKARGIPLAGGTDAPFGSADPWLAIRTAVTRRTDAGEVLGADEALTPEDALALFLGHPDRPSLPRRIETGAAADLCLLNRPWAEARLTLTSDLVSAAFRAGRRIF